MIKANNKGFSYVEMIIVLAIMMIMVGFLTISIGTNRRNEVARAAEKFESRVNQARVAALTKGNANNGHLNIAFVDGAYYTYVGEEVTDINLVKAKGEKLCNGNVHVTIAGPINAASPYARLKFKQSSGGLVDAYGNDFTMDLNIMFEKNLSSVHYSIDGLTGKIER